MNRLWMLGWPILLVMVFVAVVAGCGSTQKKPEKPQQTGPVSPPRALPPIETVLKALDDRASHFPRLWSRHVTTVDFDEQTSTGIQRRTEQLEGNLLYIAPRQLLVLFNKLGNTYAVLGSNEQRYWWFELGDAKRGSMGTHARLTPDRARNLGLPVAPTELMRLLGLRSAPPRPGVKPSLAWSRDNRSLILTRAVEGGEEHVWLDPATYEPTRVELSSGGPRPTRLISQLSKYAPVTIESGFKLPSGQPAQRVRIPEEVRLSLWVDDAGIAATSVRMLLFDPELSQRRPKADIFNFETLAKAYRIDPRAITSLDEQPDRVAPAPPATSPKRTTQSLEVDQWR